METSVAPIQSVQETRSVAVVAAIVPLPDVVRLPPFPITKALVFVPAETPEKATASAVIPERPLATPALVILHVPLPRVSPAAIVTVPEDESKVKAPEFAEDKVTAPNPV